MDLLNLNICCRTWNSHTSARSERTQKNLFGNLNSRNVFAITSSTFKNSSNLILCTLVPGQACYLHKRLDASYSSENTALWKTKLCPCLVDRSVKHLSPDMGAYSSETISFGEFSDVEVFRVV